MVDAIDFDALVKRQLAWDILPCRMAPGYMGRLGLIPGTPGGDEVEHRQSHKRLHGADPIGTVVKEYSELAGEIAGTAILEHQGHQIEDDDPKLQHYRDTVASCTQAVIANLIDAGILRIADEGINA